MKGSKEKIKVDKKEKKGSRYMMKKQRQ